MIELELGSPAAKQRFLSEINRAQVHEIVTVFAKWQQIAADITAAVERGREFAEAETGEMPRCTARTTAYCAHS